MSRLASISRFLMRLISMVATLFAVTALAETSFAAPADGDPATGGGNIPLVSYPAPYVEQARAASARTLGDVEDVICQEHVERYRLSQTGAFNLIDTIDAQVAVENGIEQYSAIRQNGVERPSLDEIGAVWSDGEYATFINDARQALNGSNRALIAGFRTTLNGTPAIVISFETDQSASSWDFMIRGHHYQLGFRGEIWVSERTGELLRCKRLADHLVRASGVKCIEWTVDFGVIRVSGKSVSVPKSATYDVQYTHSGMGSRNAISFANYQRFGAETAIRFE